MFELDDDATEYSQGLLESTDYRSPEGWFQADRTGVGESTAEYEVGPVGEQHTQSVEVDQREVDRLAGEEATAEALHEAYLEEKPGDTGGDATEEILEHFSGEI